MDPEITDVPFRLETRTVGGRTERVHTARSEMRGGSYDISRSVTVHEDGSVHFMQITSIAGAGTTFISLNVSPDGAIGSTTMAAGDNRSSTNLRVDPVEAEKFRQNILRSATEGVWRASEIMVDSGQANQIIGAGTDMNIPQTEEEIGDIPFTSRTDESDGPTKTSWNASRDTIGANDSVSIEDDGAVFAMVSRLNDDDTSLDMSVFVSPDDTYSASITMTDAQGNTKEIPLNLDPQVAIDFRRALGAMDDDPKKVWSPAEREDFSERMVNIARANGFDISNDGGRGSK